jgi:polyisoprenoid-binding protein YceI
MKTRIITSIIALQFVMAAAWAQTFTADAAKSTLNWKAEKITGFHEGTLNLKSGSFKVENGKITSGKFTVDMNSIACTDLTDAEYNGKLVGHLKSADFFDVAKFAEAVFTITKPVDVSKSVTEVHGNLTIKGISKPITFKANILKNDNSFIFNANSIVVDRTLYNIKYGSGSFFSDLGDKAIYDEFTIRLKIVANK